MVWRARILSAKGQDRAHSYDSITETLFLRSNNIFRRRNGGGYGAEVLHGFIFEKLFRI